MRMPFKLPPSNVQPAWCRAGKVRLSWKISALRQRSTFVVASKDVLGGSSLCLPVELGVADMVHFASAHLLG